VGAWSRHVVEAGDVPFAATFQEGPDFERAARLHRTTRRPLRPCPRERPGRPPDGLVPCRRGREPMRITLRAFGLRKAARGPDPLAERVAAPISLAVGVENPDSEFRLTSSFRGVEGRGFTSPRTPDPNRTPVHWSWMQLASEVSTWSQDHLTAIEWFRGSQQPRTAGKQVGAGLLKKHLDKQRWHHSRSTPRFSERRRRGSDLPLRRRGSAAKRPGRQTDGLA
jgi:hypothetical protein